MSFQLELKEFINVSLGSADRVKKAASIELFNRVVLDTPVDTGRARANWLVSLHHGGFTPSNRTDAAKALGDIEVEVNGSDLHDTLTLTNNLPYIEKLENGSSTQAPKGMMKRNVITMANLIKKQVALRGRL